MHHDGCFMDVYVFAFAQLALCVGLIWSGVSWLLIFSSESAVVSFSRAHLSLSVDSLALTKVPSVARREGEGAHLSTASAAGAAPRRAAPSV